ncbi:hypothetical protein BDZ45DRAFT_746401 [Acephala macrosclerotiorum]|nr:hypothetical protein BDZ45DRAFT_746401 [Acephala macrosclerotiorum]
MGTYPPQDDFFMKYDQFISSSSVLDSEFDPQLGLVWHDAALGVPGIGQTSIQFKREGCLPAPFEKSIVQVGVQELSPVDQSEFSSPVIDVTIPTNLRGDFHPFKSSLDGNCGLDFGVNFDQDIFSLAMQPKTNHYGGIYPQTTTHPTDFDLINAVSEIPELLLEDDQSSSRRPSEDSNSSGISFNSSLEETIVVDTIPPAVPLNKHGQPRRKRGRKRSNISDEERKRRRLERGKHAANKCRSKKKEKEDALIAQVNALALVNEEKRGIADLLKKEKMMLETMLSSCAVSETCLVPGSNLSLLRKLSTLVD